MALNYWLPNIEVYKNNQKVFYSLIMSIIEPYKILGQEMANIEIGTMKKPKKWTSNLIFDIKHVVSKFNVKTVAIYGQNKHLATMPKVIDSADLRIDPFDHEKFTLDVKLSKYVNIRTK